MCIAKVNAPELLIKDLKVLKNRHGERNIYKFGH